MKRELCDEGHEESEGWNHGEESMSREQSMLPRHPISQMHLQSLFICTFFAWCFVRRLRR